MNTKITKNIMQQPKIQGEEEERGHEESPADEGVNHLPAEHTSLNRAHHTAKFTVLNTQVSLIHMPAVWHRDGGHSAPRATSSCGAIACGR